MPQKHKLGVEENSTLYKIISGVERAATRKGGVAQATINQWVHNYEADGVEAFLSPKTMYTA